MNFCPKCGNQLNPNASFCGNCGSSIDTSGQNQTNPLINQEKKEVPAGFSSSNPDFRMPNTQRRIVKLWYLISLVFLLCVFIPSIIGLDGMNGGFAMSFMAGFMVIVGLIVILVYRARARQLDKILEGEGRIALWQYTPEEWIRFVTKDFEEEKKLKLMLFFLVAGVSVVIGILLTINSGDPVFIPIILGIIVIVAIPALWAPRYRFRKLQHSEAKVLIAEKGIIIGKMFHLWVQMGAQLDSVVIDMENDPKLIEFTYSMPTRTGRQEEVARVPVPKGNLEEAMRIVEHFNTSVN